MKDTEQETRGLRASRSADKHDPTRQIVEGEIYEEGEEPTTYDVAKVLRRRLVLFVKTTILVGLLLLVFGIWLFGPDLGFPRTYTYQWEGENWSEPSAEDAIKYARLALAERVMDTGEYNLLGEPRSSTPDRWLVQFTAVQFTAKEQGIGRWHAWTVWMDFKEDEVEVKIGPNM